MIDFSTLQGLTIPEGVVTQIADASGMVLWAVSGGKVILEVEKVTTNTYANSTTYSNESFVGISVRPKPNGIVKFTYGGLTKTITDTDANANVFFGTFNGVSDEVETPASGELTIEGDYYAFGSFVFNTDKSTIAYAFCVTAVRSFGNITDIPANAFGNASSYDFNPSVRLQQDIVIPSGVTSIGLNAFGGTAITSIILPATLVELGGNVFVNCSALKSITFLATTPPTLIGTDLFSGRLPPEGLKIIVPMGCGDAYKEALSNHADYITEVG